MPTKLRCALIIPTLNAESQNWGKVLNAIDKQSYQPDVKLILDSNSSDNTVNLAEQHGFSTQYVTPGSYDHAGTRKEGIEYVKELVDIVIFLTQDALLANNNSLFHLIAPYQDNQVALVYGRQLPNKQARPIETFGRLFNYPPKSNTRSIADLNQYGMKLAFCSNSYASFRLSSLFETNAFPHRSIVGEDFISASTLLFNGYKVHYEALAMAEHSHDYSIVQEFKRYFDIGVFHEEFSALIKKLGTSEAAGGQYVINELKFLFKNHPSQVFLSLIRTVSKYLGYKLGKQHQHLSIFFKKKLSMHHFYFK